MGIRTTAFSDEYMEQRFGALHRLTVEKDAPTPKLGYPDTGAGFFAKELPYADWYRFNITQRIHGNSIEHLSWFLPLLML